MSGVILTTSSGRSLKLDQEKLVFRIRRFQELRARPGAISCSLAPMLPLVSNTMPTESGASSLENCVTTCSILSSKALKCLLVQAGDEAAHGIGDRNRDLHQRRAHVYAVGPLLSSGAFKIFVSGLGAWRDRDFVVVCRSWLAAPQRANMLKQYRKEKA